MSADEVALSDWVAATDAAFDAAGLEWTADAVFAHAVLASLMGQADQVRTYGDTAIDLALNADDRYLASFQCALLSMFLTVARDHDSAIRRAEQAHTLAVDVGNPSLNALAETSLGFALSPIDPDAAIPHLRSALPKSKTTSIEGLHDTGGRCLARLLAGQGGFIAALETYADCLDRAMDVGVRLGITLACDSLAVDLVTAGHHELAAIIFGALEVPMAEYRGNSLIPRDAAKSALQRTLGEERFEEYAARGRAMTIDDLAIYTRTEIARLLAEPADPSAHPRVTVACSHDHESPDKPG
jgi:hypothetical protein